MAIVITHSNEPQAFIIKCKNLNTQLTCCVPNDIYMLMERLLVGWDIIKESYSTFDLNVGKAEKYSIHSRKYGLLGRSRDLVSSFNFLVNAISYEILCRNPKFQLVHAAGFTDKTSVNIILGGKKAGKSSFVSSEAGKFKRCIGDDLLLWDGNKTIIALGFPVRLRRPIDTNLIKKLGNNNLLVGRSLAFVNPNVLKQWPAGNANTINRFYLLREYRPQEITFENGLSELKTRLIKLPSEQSLIT